MTDCARMLALLRSEAKRLGRPPTSREARAAGYHYRAMTMFGGWNAAIEAAGLTSVLPGRNALPPKVSSRDRIPLTSHGRTIGWALVDPDDYDGLCDRHWNLGSDGYAYGRIEGRQTAMHRYLLGLGKGEGGDVDHINGVRLDNRRANLRTVTRAQNLENRRAPITGVSRFRGVVATKGRWMARASRNNRTVYIGIFDDELEAARAAQDWRHKHMPYAPPDPELEALAI